MFCLVKVGVITNWLEPVPVPVVITPGIGPWWALPWALPWALGPPLGPSGALRGSGPAGPWALVGPCRDRALPWALVGPCGDRALRGPAGIGPCRGPYKYVKTHILTI